jgi:tetratricopeptide (TPR) repeat protein/superfamily II DNA or RNA helicase
MERLDDALKDLNEALKIQPECPFTLSIRGDLYRRQGKLDEAFKDLNAALKIQPESPFTLASRSELYRKQGQCDEALKDMNAALKINPDHSNLLTLRSEIHKSQRKFDDALNDTNAALKIQPNNPSALALRGDVYRRQGKLDESLKDLNSSLKITPQYAFALSRRGDVYRKMERLDDALKDLNAALKIKPEYDFVFASRGDIYLQQGKFDEALKDLNEALKIKPEYAFALVIRGSVYRQQGNFKRALCDLNKAIDLDPDNIFAQSIRTDVLNQSQDETILKFKAQVMDSDDSRWIEPSNGFLHDSFKDAHEKQGSSVAHLINEEIENKPETQKYILKDVLSSSAQKDQLIANNVVQKLSKAVNILFEEEIDATTEVRQQNFDGIRPHITIDPKYLSGIHTRLPEINTTVPNSSRDWLKNPFLTLNEVGNSLFYDEIIKSIPVSTPEFAGTYMTANPQPLTSEERCTFVMLGRKSHGLAPLESTGGRVIFVVPQQDAADAAAWVSPLSDVLVVNSLNKNFIGNNNLGLVTVRRFAALSFALKHGLKHMIMTDDNIESLYISEKLIGEGLSGWKQIYQLFQSASKSSKTPCISARTFRREIDENKPNAAKIEVDTTKFGFKIFYIDLESLAMKVRHPEDLLPDRADIWGEDFFFQYAMHFAGLNVGILKREAFLFVRSKTNTNLCKKVVKPATAWLDHKTNPNRPYFALKAEEALLSEVRRNISKTNNYEHKIASLDLSILAEKLQNKRRIEAMIPLDIALETIPPAKKKRAAREIDCIPHTEIVGDSAESDTFAGFLQELAETISLIVTCEYQGKPIDIMRLGEQEILIPQTYRESQQKAFYALAASLQNGIHCGYFEMAPGTGKTRIFATLAALAMLSPMFKKNVLIVTPTLELVEQTHQEVTRFNAMIEPSPKSKVIKVSTHNISQQLLQTNTKLHEGGYTIICCESSLRKLLDSNAAILNFISLFVIDESHEISPEILKIGQEFASNRKGLTFNFTATPESKRDLMGESIFRYSAQEGVQEKILSPWIIERIGVNFNKESLQAFLLSLPRILETRNHPHGGVLAENKGIIYVPNIEDAEFLEKILRDHGVKAAATHSKKKNNQTIIDEFKKDAFCSEINFLIAIDKLKIGFDAKVDYVMIARKSLPRSDWLQILGRALRSHVPTSFRPDEIAGKKIEQQKIAYLMVFDEVELPLEILHSFENLRLNHEFLTQEVKYNFSLNRKVVSIQEKIDFAPSSPAISFAFSNAQNKIPIPMTVAESVLIPVKYGDGTLARAIGMGTLWQQKEDKDEEIITGFGLVRTICSKYPQLREMIRKNEKTTNNDLEQLLSNASHLLNQHANENIVNDALIRYQIQVFEYDPVSRLFQFREQMGNSKSLQIIRLSRSFRNFNGRVFEHYDLLLFQNNF